MKNEKHTDTDDRSLHGQNRKFDLPFDRQWQEGISGAQDQGSVANGEISTVTTKKTHPLTRRRKEYHTTSMIGRSSSNNPWQENVRMEDYII
jgi:hypothetical protein